MLIVSEEGGLGFVSFVKLLLKEIFVFFNENFFLSMIYVIKVSG